MTLNFVPAYDSAVDMANNITVYAPRMHPGTGPDEIEFQYPIAKNGMRYGVGCRGTGAVISEDGKQIQIVTLELGAEPVLRHLVSLKLALGIDGNFLDFLQGLSDGLVKVFLSRTDNDLPVRYLALCRHNQLGVIGIEPSPRLHDLPGGPLVLARSDLPAHPLDTAS